MNYFKYILIVGLLWSCQNKESENKQTEIKADSVSGVVKSQEQSPAATEEAELVPYKVVVMYHQNPESEADWEFYATDIEEAVSRLGVQIINADKMGEVDIKIDGKLVDKINLKSYFGKHQKGYVFAQNGKAPQFCTYDVSDFTIQQAEDYFNAE